MECSSTKWKNQDLSDRVEGLIKQVEDLTKTLESLNKDMFYLKYGDIVSPDPYNSKFGPKLDPQIRLIRPNT